MCGIAGFINPNSNSNSSENILSRMLSCLIHRGPDDHDMWFDKKVGLALGHRRLSILDLSPFGRQPMTSSCQRYVITLNGEIYNWFSLKEELEHSGKAPRWKGSSDTEIFLAAISAWGVLDTLNRVRGMFAFALWDNCQKCLTLARDRIGEKPLYYGTVNGNFAFASELKALSALSQTPLDLEQDAVALMLRYGYVPEPYSIYKKINKLPPGTMISISPNGQVGEVQHYWSFTDFASEHQKNPIQLSDANVVDEFERLMVSSIKEQMVADVPLGAFLSGGLDSSSVVAVMQRNSQRPVKTFTVGYNESSYNEAEHAKEIAKYLGTEHTELRISAKQSLDVIPSLPDIYDEPFADVSQIPATLIAKLTSEHVSVCLSGDAGDELFGGYNRYLWTNVMWKWLGMFPASARKPIGQLLNQVPIDLTNRLHSLINPMLPKSYNINNPGDKLHKVSQIFAAQSRDQLYQFLVSQWRGPLPLKNIVEPPTFLSQPEKWPVLGSYSERMMAVDTVTYLPQDILVKVDRAAMSAGLETRIPFLDLRLLEFSWRLPINQKIRNGEGKWVIRQLLSRYIPKSLWDRPKQGFAVPIEHWLRGPLREWADDLLAPEKLANDEFLDPRPIRRIWEQHQSGQNMQYALWNIIMYRAWRERWH